MKPFDKFIRYLAITGVLVAAFYFLLPDLAKSLFTSYGAIIGPIIVIALFAFAFLRKPHTDK